MKFKIGILALATLFAANIYGEEIEVRGGSSRTQITLNTDLSNTLWLNSATGNLYKGSETEDIYYSAVRATNGTAKGDVSLAFGKLVIDINSNAEGSISAMDVGNWSTNFGNVEIKNSVSNSKTVANVDATSLNFFSDNAQDQSLSFTNVVSNVNISGTSKIGSSVDAAKNNMSTLALNGTSDVTWSAASGTTINKYAQITVSANSKLTIAKGNFNVNGAAIQNSGLVKIGSDSGSVTAKFASGTTFNGGTLDATLSFLTIDKGATVSVNRLYTGSGHLLTVNGELSVATASAINNLYLGGKLSTVGDTSFNRNATFASGSTFTTTGNISISSGVTDPTNPAYTTFTIESGNALFKMGSDFTIKNAVTMVLNKENAIVDAASKNDVSIIVESNATNAKLDVNASNEFKSISTATVFDIYLTAGAELSAAFDVNAGGKIVLHDFVDDLVYVKNNDQMEYISNVFDAYKMVDGVEIKIENLYFNNGYLTSSNPIPEPAEWAAILGALALSIAIYRKRK